MRKGFKMNICEIEWFANHKYGENVYIVKQEKEILIFTIKGKWRIFLNDLDKFDHYTLFHMNHKGYYSTDCYHQQCTGRNIEWLVYYAIRHDLDIPANFPEFQRLYDMYLLGREIEERVAYFNFLCD